jgi:PemK-like, MazF-like toxin of type II toxin-antitoxin system
MASLIPGRIVWATVLDPQGRNPKDRPLVILSALSKDAADEDELVVVAITTQGNDAAPANCVLLPWSRNPACITKLSERCWADCRWLCKIKKGAIRKVGGLVPSHILQQILATINDLKQSAPSVQGPPTS